MNQDATLPFNINKVDAVIMNSPFGKKVGSMHDGYMINGLDENMVVNAIDNLKENGRAAIIIGGHTKYKDNGSLASEKGFLNYLYNYFNVSDIINIDGALYSKQGTSFPIRMILLDGKRGSKEEKFAPLGKFANSEIITTFDKLYDRVNNNLIKKEKDENVLLHKEIEISNDGGDGIHRGNGDGQGDIGGYTSESDRGNIRVRGESISNSSGQDAVRNGTTSDPTGRIVDGRKEHKAVDKGADEFAGDGLFDGKNTRESDGDNAEERSESGYRGRGNNIKGISERIAVVDGDVIV